MAQRVLHQCCNIGVSRRVQSLSQLHSAYREALEAFSYTHHQDNPLCFISDLQPPTQVHADTMQDLVERVIVAFKNGNRSELMQTLDEIVALAHGELCSKDWLDIASMQIMSDI